MLASGLLHATQDNLSVAFKTKEASVVKVLDSMIDWISDIGRDSESEHSGKFAPILLGACMFLMMLTLLISA
jgi:hypothetical protein